MVFDGVGLKGRCLSDDSYHRDQGFEVLCILLKLARCSLNKGPDALSVVDDFRNIPHEL